MTEREQVESALRKSENELRLLSGRLLSVEEKERKRIARELHDGIGQALSAIKFGVENTLRSLQREPASAAVDSLKQIVPFAQKTIEEVRPCRIFQTIRNPMRKDRADATRPAVVGLTAI